MLKKVIIYSQQEVKKKINSSIKALFIILEQGLDVHIKLNIGCFLNNFNDLQILSLSATRWASALYSIGARITYVRETIFFFFLKEVAPARSQTQKTVI